MPGPNDSDNELEGTEEEETETTEETSESGEPTEGQSSESAGADKSEKRIRDLQSKADAAEARANKAEAALKAKNADKGTAGGVDPATQALMQEVREASLDAIYGEFPQLKQYGIDRSLIEGSTRAELRANATSLVGLIKSVSTKVRNETLSEHGLVAPASGSTRQAPVDYGSMKDEDFLKLLDSM